MSRCRVCLLEMLLDHQTAQAHGINHAAELFRVDSLR
jgi:hypothetical protein